MGATGSTGIAAPSCANYRGADVWFSVTVPASGNLRVSTSSAAGSPVSDTGLAAYSGTCGTLAEVACNDDTNFDAFAELLLLNQTPGQVLLVRSWVNGNSDQGEYGICAREVPACAAPTTVAITARHARLANVTFTENELVNGDYQVSYTTTGGPALTVDGSNGIADTDLGLYSAATPAGPWQLSPGTSRQAPASAPGTITATALSHLSVWTLGSTAAPLPVQLVSFSAEAAGPAALLRWATASEKNSAYFAIEASTDGRAFQAAGQVTAHGTTTHASAYEFRDANLRQYGSRTVYYRLRQVDNDDRTTYSPVRPVAVAQSAEVALAIAAYPVPFAQHLTVQVRTAATGPAHLTLRDAWGRLLLQQTADLPPGLHEVELAKASQLPAGIYLLTVE